MALVTYDYYLRAFALRVFRFDLGLPGFRGLQVCSQLRVLWHLGFLVAEFISPKQCTLSVL